MIGAKVSAATSVEALSALAHEGRLHLFRTLVRQGPAGLKPGQLAKACGMPDSTLSFHLAQLLRAGLVSRRRAGRTLIYAADFGTMNALLGYLMENCCAGTAEAACGPAACAPAALAPARASAAAAPVSVRRSRTSRARGGRRG